MISTAAQETSVSSLRTPALREFQKNLDHLIQRGGPHPSEYALVNRAIERLSNEVRAGLIDLSDLKTWMREVTLKCFQGTMQAESILKKHGYSGDFEIIDHIYQMKIANEPHLRRWDLFFHAQSAPCAVRNRKAYFHRLLNQLAAENPGQKLRILNIASGPARDLREWFDANPSQEIHFDCIELDPNAIHYASNLCSTYRDRIHFHQQNALKFIPSGKYDLIWSAGLFDYLTDRLFVRLTRSLLPFVKPGRQVVVGNFSELNSSRDYMELMGDWCLRHRSEATLRSLAIQTGTPAGSVRVDWEPEGVNLFLHVSPH